MARDSSRIRMPSLVMSTLQLPLRGFLLALVVTSALAVSDASAQRTINGVGKRASEYYFTIKTSKGYYCTLGHYSTLGQKVLIQCSSKSPEYVNQFMLVVTDQGELPAVSGWPMLLISRTAGICNSANHTWWHPGRVSRGSKVPTQGLHTSASTDMISGSEVSQMKVARDGERVMSETRKGDDADAKPLSLGVGQGDVPRRDAISQLKHSKTGFGPTIGLASQNLDKHSMHEQDALGWRGLANGYDAGEYPTEGIGRIYAERHQEVDGYEDAENRQEVDGTGGKKGHVEAEVADDDVDADVVLCNLDTDNPVEYYLYHSVDSVPGVVVDFDTEWLYLKEENKFCTIEDIQSYKSILVCNLDTPESAVTFQFQTVAYPFTSLASVARSGPCGIKSFPSELPHDVECSPGPTVLSPNRVYTFSIISQKAPVTQLVSGSVVAIHTYSEGLISFPLQQCCTMPRPPYILDCWAPDSPGSELGPECWFTIHSFPDVAGTPLRDGDTVMLQSKQYSRYCSTTIDGTMLCFDYRPSTADRNLFVLGLNRSNQF